MERSFVSHLSKPLTPAGAAQLAGYRAPADAGTKLMKNETIASSVRAEAQRFLRQVAGPEAVYNHYKIAMDERMPPNTRVAAGRDLMNQSGIASDDGVDTVDLHDATPQQLDAIRRRAEANITALDRIMSDMAKPIEAIEDEPGSAFD